MGIRIQPKDLGRELRGRFKGIERDLVHAMNTSAMRGQAILASRTPRDTGRAAAGWRVRKGRVWGNQFGRGFVAPQIENPAPHIGVLEAGARPHPVSKEGIDALASWARRRLGASKEEARKIANAIAWKIRRKGQKPTYFVRDSLDDIVDAFSDELNRVLTAHAGRRASRR